MKKILFMLLAVMGVFSSCSNKVDDLYNPDMTAALKNAQYNRAFLSQFGNIDPYHTWGFNNLGSRASDMSSNQWSDNWYTPDNITEDERAAVLAEFSKVREGAVNTIIIDSENYWIQQVYKGTSTYKDANGNTVNNGEPVSNKMDYLLAYNAGSSDCISIYPEWNNYQAVKTDYEHVNNFNQGNNTAVNTRQEGNEVLEIKYDFVEKFVNGFARVKIGAFYGLIDQSAKFVIEPTYHDLGPMGEMGMYARSGSRYGVINIVNGKKEEVIPFKYKYMRNVDGKITLFNDCIDSVESETLNLT